MVEKHKINLEGRAEKLPEDWKLTTLGEVLEWGSGGTPLKAHKEFYDGDIPWAIISDLNDGIVNATQTKITKKGLENSSAKWVETGSLLIAMYGSIGKLGISGIPLTTNQAIAFTTPNTNIDVKYLFYYLLSKREELIRLGSGATQQNISQTKIKAFPFRLAPIRKQKQIVTKIDTLFSQLDAGVAALKRAQANLARYKASVLKAACEGRLVPTEAELARREGREYEHAEVLLARILEERRQQWEAETWQKQIERAKKKAAQAVQKAAGKRGYIRDLKDEDWQDLPEEVYAPYLPKNDNWKKKYQEPEPPDTSGLPELPEGWTWATVEQVADHRLGKMLDKSKNVGELRPYLRNINVRWFEFDLSDIQEMRVEEKELDEICVEKDDLVICEGGEPGRSSVWSYDYPMVIQKALHKVKCHKGILPWFVCFQIASDANSGSLRKYFTGSTISHFTGQSLSNYEISLPPTIEQARIVEKINELLYEIKNLEAYLNKIVYRLDIEKKTVLKHAFSGLL